eukprot:1161535-Pelagomonas_calceolata.AAC.2
MVIWGIQRAACSLSSFHMQHQKAETVGRSFPGMQEFQLCACVCEQVRVDVQYSWKLCHVLRHVFRQTGHQCNQWRANLAAHGVHLGLYWQYIAKSAIYVYLFTKNYIFDLMTRLRRVFNTWGVCVKDPAALRRVFQTNQRAYEKDLALSYHPFLPILGSGLVTSDGELWQKQRLLIGPALRTGMYSLQEPTLTTEACKSKWGAMAEAAVAGEGN